MESIRTESYMQILTKHAPHSNIQLYTHALMLGVMLDGRGGGVRDGVAIHGFEELSIGGALALQLPCLPLSVFVVEGDADVPRGLEEDDLEGVHADAVIRPVP
jgi:hypothetical protein